MKKEAVNTFQQGLNYDLNPITTPNNVLTDCVNGSFVTFNGDELALQNDAGNTKIVSQFRDSDGDPAEMWEGIYTYSIGSIVYMPEDPDKYYIKTTAEDTIPTTLIGWDVYIPGYIKLTDRFYPLGVKEYGGVLYIVSGCDYYEKDLIATDWDENHPYKKGDVVRYQGYYFRSLKDDNTTSLADPIFSEDEQYIMLHKDSAIMSFESDWEWIDESELGEKIQKVEFGSYPSPESSGLTEYSSNELSNDILYKPTVINNKVFQTGDYIVFSINKSFDTTYISNYDNDFNYVPKFYKVKLFHQLNNGLLDITDEVWKQYYTYLKEVKKDIGGKFWFNDPNFKFKCPSQYKGKLAISLEIEDELTLELKDTPSLELDSVTGNYKYSLTVKTSNFGYLSIDSVYAKIYLGDEVKLTKTAKVTNNLATIEFNLASNFAQKTIRYEIIPNILVNNPAEGANDYLYRTEDTLYTTTYIEYLYSELPEDFSNKLVINGQRLISSTLDGVVFVYERGTCNYTTQVLTYGKVSITNPSGENIDHKLNRSTNKYVFLLNGQTLETGETLIANYTIGTDGKPEVSSYLEGTSENLKAAFQNLVLSLVSDSCKKLSVTINTNTEYDSLNVSQDGVTLVPTEVTATSKKFTVRPDTNFIVSASKAGFEDINTPCNVNQESVLEFAFIANFEANPTLNTEIPGKEKYDWNISWAARSELVGAVIQATPYTIGYDSITASYVELNYATTTTPRLSVTILSNALSTTYQNIPSSEISNYVYILYNSTITIFRKQYIFTD